MSLKLPIQNSLNRGYIWGVYLSRFKRAKSTKYPTPINTPVVKSANRLTKLSTNVLYIVFCIFTTVVVGVIIIYDRVQNSRHLYILAV